MLQKIPLPANEEKAIPSLYSSLLLILAHKITGAIPNAIPSQSSEMGREAMIIMVITLDSMGGNVKIMDYLFFKKWRHKQPTHPFKLCSIPLNQVKKIYIVNKWVFY